MAKKTDRRSVRTSRARATTYEADIREDFKDVRLDFKELRTELSNKLAGFTSLQVSADTQDTALLSRLVQTRSVITELSNRIMFFELWFRSLDDSRAARLIDAAEGYRYYLTKLRNFKPHMLSEAEEKVINIKNMTGSNVSAA